MEIITGTPKEFLVHLGFKEVAGILTFESEKGKIQIELADFYKPSGVLNAIIESVLSNG